MVQILKTILTCSILLLFQTSLVYAATLSSTVNRNQLSSNETLILTVSYDENVDSSKLSYGVLEKDFDILNVTPQSTSSVSIVNGRATRVSTTAWAITLVPKREGQLLIPAFTINSDTSKPITISVDSSAQSGNNATQALQAWVVANSDSIYPSQQLIVDIEISAQSNIGNLNGPELVVKDAKVESLGQQSFQRVDNGVARQHVLLKYAVFAEKPGELIIPRMTFTAVKGGQQGFFGSRGQKVVARTEQLAIKVREIPNNSKAAWFPAESVKIRSEWSSDINAVKVGEPITRTITVTAQSQQAETISPLAKPSELEGIKAYKDQPQLHTQATNEGFVGTRIESSAIVASKEGPLTLPELTVDWWNVKTEQWEQAKLPAETLTVTGTALTLNSDKPIVQSTDQLASPSNDTNLVRALMVALLALSLLCLTQLWMIMRLRKSPEKSVLPKDSSNPSEASAWRQLKTSLSTNHAKPRF